MTPLGKFLPIVGQPNPAEPKDVHLVGRYAVGVTWGDDHSSIYPFDRLRLDDPAGGEADQAALTQEMTWPSEIKKLPGGAAGDVAGRPREPLSVSHAARALPVRGLHRRPLMSGELDAAARRGLVLSGVMAAVFLAAMESTVVATAMPTVIASLGGIRDLLVDVLRLSPDLDGDDADLGPARRSARPPRLLPRRARALPRRLGAVGLSHSMAQLIAFRALQGLGAGLPHPDRHDDHRRPLRPRAPRPDAGLLLERLGRGVAARAARRRPPHRRLSWRWVFYLNLPPGLLAVLAIAMRSPVERPARRPGPFDYAGMALFSAGHREPAARAGRGRAPRVVAAPRHGRAPRRGRRPARDSSCGWSAGPPSPSSRSACSG